MQELHGYLISYFLRWRDSVGVMDEIGKDFTNTLLGIGALLLGVFVFVMFTISIWLLVAVLVVAGGAWMLYQMKR